MDITGPLRRTGVGALVGVALLTLALTASAAMGQGRGSVRIQSPGGIRSPGHSSSTGVSQFRSFSYGAGQVGGGGGGGNVLQSRVNTTMRSQLSSVVTRPTRSPLVSNISSPNQAYSRSPAGTYPPGGGADPISATRTVHRYSVTTPPVPGGGPVGSMTAPTHTGPTGVYLQALTHRQEPSVLAQDEPIRSLAPKRPSMLRTMIRDGEKAFRKGDYNEAVKKFNLAYTLDSKSPEAALSLFHAQFATSKVSYGSAGYLLSRTLRLLPELPLAPLDVRGFYGVEGDYDRHVGQLEQFVREHGGDPGAWLIVAYFRWFDGDTSGAEAALAAGKDHAEQDHMIEALAIFADGIATDKARADESDPAEADPAEAGPAAPPTEGP